MFLNPLCDDSNKLYLVATASFSSSLDKIRANSQKFKLLGFFQMEYQSAEIVTISNYLRNQANFQNC